MVLSLPQGPYDKLNLSTTLPIYFLLHLFFLTDNSSRKPVTLENQSVATEADITFTVEATGDDLQFQWQKDGKDIDSNDCLPSPTDHSSTLQIQCVDKGHYRCLVKSSVEESRKESLHGAELQSCKFRHML